MEGKYSKLLFSLLILIALFSFSLQIDTKIIDQYIEELMTKSTAEIPVWNIEKAKAGKKSGWDYIDGCMINSILSLYEITNDVKYLNFADNFIGWFVNEDGTISIPMENGDFISMTEQHYWDSRKKMQEYNELHRNDPQEKKTKVIRIKQIVSASAWVDAGDLRSDPYDETEIETDVIVEDDDADWLPQFH